MDCKVCLPDVLSENKDAEKIYLMVQDQVIVGMNGVVALNQNAIHSAIKLYNIEFEADCFEKVVAVGRHFINKMHEDKK